MSPSYERIANASRQTPRFCRGPKPLVHRDGRPLSGKELVQRARRDRKRREARVVERQLAQLDECLELIRGQRASVEQLLRWGLEHPGQHPVGDLVSATKLSLRSIKAATQVLLGLDLATPTEVRHGRGSRRLWRFHPPAEEGRVVDHPGVQRVQEGVAHLGDRDSSALTRENVVVASGGGVATLGVMPVNADEVDADASPSSAPDAGITPNAVTPAEPTEPAPLDDEDDWDLVSITTPITTARPKHLGVRTDDQIWSEEPALAHYADRIRTRGTVHADQLDRIAATLLEAQEVHGDGIAFVDALMARARHPYRANVVEHFFREYQGNPRNAVYGNGPAPDATVVELRPRRSRPDSGYGLPGAGAMA